MFFMISPEMLTRSTKGSGWIKVWWPKCHDLVRLWRCYLCLAVFSIQGLHPLREGESASAVIKWDGLAFGAFPVKVTIHTKWCRHFLLFFFGRTENLGICEATKDCSGASSKKWGKEGAFGGAFGLGQPSRSVVTYLASKCGSLNTLDHSLPDCFQLHNVIYGWNARLSLSVLPV